MSKNISAPFSGKEEEIIWLKQQLLSQQQTPDIALRETGNIMLFAYLALLSLPLFCTWYLFFVLPIPWQEQFKRYWPTDVGLLVLAYICIKYALINIYSRIYPPLIIRRNGLKLRSKTNLIWWQEIDSIRISPYFSTLNFIFPLWNFTVIEINYLVFDFINFSQPLARQKKRKLLINKLNLSEEMIVKYLTKYRNNAFARYRLRELGKN